jgi:hypothetical protein
MDMRLKEITGAVTKRFVLPETLLLVSLCTWDMIYTLYCVRLGIAKETNPELKRSLAQSNTAFLLLKGATFLLPVAILEIIRTWRPQLVTLAMRIGFIAYAIIYISGSIALSGTI